MFEYDDKTTISEQIAAESKSFLDGAYSPAKAEVKYITAPVKLTLEIFDGDKKLQEVHMDIRSNIVTAQLDIHDLIEKEKIE